MKRMYFSYILWIVFGIIICTDAISDVKTNDTDITLDENDSGYIIYIIAMGVLLPVVLMGGLGWYLFAKQKKAKWVFDIEAQTAVQKTLPPMKELLPQVIEQKKLPQVMEQKKLPQVMEQKKLPQENEQKTLPRTPKKKKKKPRASMKKIIKKSLEDMGEDEEQESELRRIPSPKQARHKKKEKSKASVKEAEPEDVEDQKSESDKTPESAIKKTECHIRIEEDQLSDKQDDLGIDYFLPLLTEYLKNRNPPDRPVHRRYEIYEWAQEIGTEPTPPASFTEQDKDDMSPSYTIVRHMQWIHEVPDENEESEETHVKHKSPVKKKKSTKQAKRSLEKEQTESLEKISPETVKKKAPEKESSKKKAKAGKKESK
ncbi:hypothetical protein XELAEV_18000315mg [Xenopus laevis]|nr:hypothetical protein XELAEV_18000315mg [Xenopus laevis]